MNNCPCHSKKAYEACCRPFHLGKNPETALQLMRSRFAAYALCLPDYIIQTTHPEGSQFHPDTKKWIEEIIAFSQGTKFKDLGILDFQEKDASATVTFCAHLTQNGQDASFTEKSHFEKVRGKWLYRSGQILNR
jgi:SEC-C motif-containing protein